MRTLFNQVKDRKIIVSVVFALVLVGAVAFSQSFISSKVSGATKTDGNGRTLGGDTQEDGKTREDGKEGDGKGSGHEDGIGELCGFAWGATSEAVIPKMGVGWVSFSSTDCDTDGNGTIDEGDTKSGGLCPPGDTSTYGVSVEKGGDLVGYAWSSNLGWLKFGGFEEFPKSDGGNDPQNARLNGDGTVTGWARFCAGTADGECGTSESRTDGWDGWVSLRGTSPTYGVEVNGDNFSGYSWGSDVVGWLNWNAGGGNNVRYCDAGPSQSLTVTLDANPSTGNAPLHTTLTATPVLDPSGDTSGATYRFKCDYSDDWSSSQSSNTYNCTYSNSGTYYHPQAEVTLGTLVSVGATEVHTDGGDTGGNLHAACSVTRPSFVGFPVTWTVSVDSPGVPPYNYTFAFSDGQGNTTINGSNNISEHVTVTYGSPGNRSLTATVADSTSPSPVTVNCNQNTNVIVKPVIIPI